MITLEQALEVLQTKGEKAIYYVDRNHKVVNKVHVPNKNPRMLILYGLNEDGSIKIGLATNPDNGVVKELGDCFLDPEEAVNHVHSLIDEENEKLIDTFKNPPEEGYKGTDLPERKEETENAGG